VSGIDDAAARSSSMDARGSQAPGVNTVGSVMRCYENSASMSIC
jgi:hypothetical protein